MTAIIRLTEHENPLVRANISWSLICWLPLSKEQLRQYYYVLICAMQQLKGDIKKSYEADLCIWKSNLSSISNKFDPDLDKNSAENSSMD